VSDVLGQLADWLRSARFGVAFTGAGMSTESGIADFRSPGGIWSRHRPVYYDEFVSSRAARIRYWQQRRELYLEFKDARPNAGHAALARLESLGCVRAVITQNIDGLHQDAGSRRVIELHGTNRVMACIACGKEWTPEELDRRLREGEEAPDCDACGAPIKSRTISFGQAMPMREMTESAELATQSDVLLALGSSLVVEPAASIPRMARGAGARLVIVNRTETPLDESADLVIREPIGATLTSVLRRIDAPSNARDADDSPVTRRRGTVVP
jgi:NAD-dependent deacetylase